MSADLIARLEVATEGSHDLDYEIYRAVNEYARNWLHDYPPGDVPRFTRSVDAALSLLPEGMAVDILFGPAGLFNEATVWRPVKGEDDQGRRTTSYEPFEAKANHDGHLRQNTPALVVCIAAMKARASQKGGT